MKTQEITVYFGKEGTPPVKEVLRGQKTGRRKEEDFWVFYADEETVNVPQNELVGFKTKNGIA